jgi:hypothetical protein
MLKGAWNKSKLWGEGNEKLHFLAPSRTCLQGSSSLFSEALLALLVSTATSLRGLLSPGPRKRKKKNALKR